MKKEDPKDKETIEALDGLLKLHPDFASRTLLNAVRGRFDTVLQELDNARERDLRRWAQDEALDAFLSARRDKPTEVIEYGRLCEILDKIRRMNAPREADKLLEQASALPDHQRTWFYQRAAERAR